MTTKKINNVAAGILRVTGLPPVAVLESKEVPEPVAVAYAEHRETAAAYAEAERVRERAHRAVAKDSTRASRADRVAEADAAVEEEAVEQRRTHRAANSAAKRLIEALKEHADEVRALAARMTLAAHAREVDSLVSAEDAAGGRVGPDVPRHPALTSWDDHGTIGEAISRRGDLDRLDWINTHALAEFAGSRCGLVEVVGVKGGKAGARILTTPRRAAMLTRPNVSTHGTRWALGDEIEEGNA